MVETKLWPRRSTEPLPSAALVQQWRWFTLASFRLGTSGRSWDERAGIVEGLRFVHVPVTIRESASHDIDGSM